VKSNIFRASSYQKANKQNFLSQEDGESAFIIIDKAIETINKIVEQNIPNFYRALALKMKGEIF